MISKNQIKAVRQLELKKYRNREGLFVAEGPKVVGDLLKCGFVPTQLYATKEWKGTNAQEVTDEELRKLSFLQHPQQVLAVFSIPHSQSSEGTLTQAKTLNSQLRHDYSHSRLVWHFNHLLL